MDAQVSDLIENAFQSQAEGFRLRNPDVYIDFSQAVQRSNCGGITRHVRRLTAVQYNRLKQQYINFYRNRTWNWCLVCRSGYILYEPRFQTVLDQAWERGTPVTISLHGHYSYFIDVSSQKPDGPIYGYQINKTTQRNRSVARIINGANTLPIYGSFMVKLEANKDPCGEDSLLERSAIY